MNPKLKNQLLDVAVILGMIGAFTLTVGFAATVGVILSVIFGGSAFWWAVGTIAVDLGVSVWLVIKIVRGFWDEIERTNMP
jgi:hypothetical protein